MYRKVLVTFLETIILADIVQIVTPDHDRPLHFHLQHYASQDSSTNAHIASKWAFLVNIVTLNSLTTIQTYVEVRTNNAGWCYSSGTNNCSSNSNNIRNDNHRLSLAN